MIVTLAEMRARCLKRWPDFAICVERHPKYGHVLRATATHVGKPMECSMVLADPTDERELADAERTILSACVAGIEVAESIS